MKKIMVVDDEKISLMMTSHILSSAYETLSASSGAEAIEIYKKEKPDMILSDLRMPGMSGYELQQALQKEFEETIPFMFMTADTDEETESKGFENGAMDFIRKPFRADVLLKRVGNILQTVEKIQGLKKAAVMDPMTGLLNKASAEREISGLCKSAQGALLMIDLDSFKLVNDIYGHAMGDKILIRFAEILRAVVRPIDVLGRLGGDEFIAFCQNVSDEIVIEKKSRFINKYITDAAREFMGEDMNIPLGASIGCVFVPEEGVDFSMLHEKADKALYAVKQRGKHGYLLYTDLSADSVKDEKQNTDLANLIKVLGERNKGRGAFVLPFERFQTAYQFLSRLNINYQKEICLLLFSIKEKEHAVIPLEDALDEFIEILGLSLRQSDLVTKNGKNQCLVILPATTSQNVAVVKERIMKKWEEADSSAMFDIKIESGKME